MIAAFLTIIGLIVAFFEKEHLFKKPITVKKVVIFLLLGAAAATAFINDISNDVKSERSAATIDSLTSRSATLNEQIVSLRKENKEAQKGYADSIISYHNYTTVLLAEYGLKVDTLTNTVKKFDTSVQKETPPTLTIFNVPQFIKTNNEEGIQYHLDASNANAHILGAYYAIIKVNDTAKTAKVPFMGRPFTIPTTMNFTTIIPKDIGYDVIFFLNRSIPKEVVDNLFILAMEFNYKSKNNKIQTPLRKVYLVDFKNHSIREADSYVFYETALFLRKHNIWRKFYNL